MKETKPFDIPKRLVWKAYKAVKANAGGAGIDQQTLSDFEKDLKDNLYKLWNRLTSGSYFPPAVRQVEIPKKAGGVRKLGVPTVSDRIAQMAVKLMMEPKLEPHFLEDSYGYRPNKSALDAIGVTRQRCWKYRWVVEFDIEGLFDNLSHKLLMKAVKHHIQERWILLYVERWLTAPIQTVSGENEARVCGTPQGGVISPLLSNIFLHYAFDKWMQREHKEIPWCRYADDGLLHCKTKAKAEEMLMEIKERFHCCGLKLHPEKTRIILCRNGKGRKRHEHMSFNFLGYTFKERLVRDKSRDSLFIGFTPAVSMEAIKAMNRRIRRTNFRNNTSISLQELARRANPMLRGWLNYYGKYNRAAMYRVWRHFNNTLLTWALKKYKSLKGNKKKGGKFLEKVYRKQPFLFVHWKEGMFGSFA